MLNFIITLFLIFAPNHDFHTSWMNMTYNEESKEFEESEESEEFENGLGPNSSDSSENLSPTNLILSF